MDQDEGLTAVDNIVTQFNTYEDFLDSQITTVDLYYLEVSAGTALPAAAGLCRPLAVTVRTADRWLREASSAGCRSPQPSKRWCAAHRLL